MKFDKDATSQPAYSRSLCCGKKLLRRYCGHSRYCSMRAICTPGFLSSTGLENLTHGTDIGIMLQTSDYLMQTFWCCQNLPYLTLPSVEGVLPPNAEASSGPICIPELTVRLQNPQIWHSPESTTNLGLSILSQWHHSLGLTHGNTHSRYSPWEH